MKNLSNIQEYGPTYVRLIKHPFPPSTATPATYTTSTKATTYLLYVHPIDIETTQKMEVSVHIYMLLDHIYDGAFEYPSQLLEHGYIILGIEHDNYGILRCT